MADPLVQLARDRDAVAAEVSARVLARTRGAARGAGEIEAHVASIAADFHPGLYRAVTGALALGLERIFTPPSGTRGDRLTIGGAIDRVRALAANATLVIAPTHSSNLDAIVLGLALRDHGVGACAYAVGEHLYRNPVAGALMHRLGGFRVERGRTSTLYKVALKTYATVLLERGVHTVIFPGATRCRTNHVEATIKLGLLGAAAAAERTGRRVVVVPATINHQVVLEAATLIAYHLAGRGHERIVGDELFVWGRLRSTARRLRALDQRVAIRFGDPLGTDGRPADLAAPRPRADPAALAAAIVAAYRRDTVLFDTHVVARALLGLPGGDHPRDVVLAAIARTVAELDARGAHRWQPERAPAALLASAVAAWHAAHSERVATLAGDRVLIDDPRLVLFYQNRCD